MENSKKVFKSVFEERDYYKKAVDDMDDYTFSKWIPRLEDRMNELKNKLENKQMDREEAVAKVEEFLKGYWPGKDDNKQYKDYFKKKLQEAEEKVAMFLKQQAQLQAQLPMEPIRLDDPLPFPTEVVKVLDSVFGKEEDRARERIIGALPKRQSFDLDESVVEEVLYDHILVIVDKLKIPCRRSGRRIKVSDLWKGLIYNALMDIDNLKPVDETDLLNRYKKE